jgi:hypothetical protein
MTDDLQTTEAELIEEGDQLADDDARPEVRIGV